MVFQLPVMVDCVRAPRSILDEAGLPCFDGDPFRKSCNQHPAAHEWQAGDGHQLAYFRRDGSSDEWLAFDGLPGAWGAPAAAPQPPYSGPLVHAWVQYEAIQADIFDHILAVVPQFDLRVFQSPSGSDFSTLK